MVNIDIVVSVIFYSAMLYFLHKYVNYREEIMSIDYNIVGERIKKARLEKQLTQENIAEKLNVSVAFLSRIERGTSHINLKRLHQICSILDVSEGYLLSGTYDDSNNYLNEEFKELLEKCTPEQQRLIYNIAKTIIENNKEQ